MDLEGVGIEVWHPWYGPEASLIDSQAAEFNKSNDWGITVRTRGHTSYTELYSAATDALRANTGPHALIALPEHALAWDADGFVVDIAAYVANPNYGFSSETVQDFPPVFWSHEIVGGRQLGLPAQRTAAVLTYNQTWAGELGFSQSPQTPQEFREQACEAHAALLRDDDPKNDGRGGWQVRTDAATFLSWLTAFGGTVQDGEGYRFLSPRNLEATVFLKELYDEGCGWVGTTDDDSGSALAARQALFGTASMEQLPEIGRAMAAAENADDWTVISFPGEERSDIVVYGSSFVMLKSTPEQQLASWLFISWMLAPEQQEKWVEVTGLFPLRASLQDQLDDYGRSHAQWTAALALLPDATAQPQLASWRQVRIMMGDGFDAMFRSDTPAGRVAEILAIMDRTARDLAP